MSAFVGTVGDGEGVRRVEATDAAHAAEEIAERHCSEACEWPGDGDALRVYVISPGGELSAHDVYTEPTVTYTAYPVEGVPLAAARLLGGAA